MAGIVVTLLAFIGAAQTSNGQDAKSVTQDAKIVVYNPHTTEDHNAVQERREKIQIQASRDEERQLIKYRKRQAEARAEAQAERQAAREARREAEAQTEAQPEATTSTTQSESITPMNGSLDWAALRNCESGSSGLYQANTGNGYYGAYQFSLSTWQSVGGTGLPSDASPAEQDSRAQMLYNRSGDSPWPVCGSLLY